MFIIKTLVFLVNAGALVKGLSRLLKREDRKNRKDFKNFKFLTKC